jgi:hypothetical protein
MIPTEILQKCQADSWLPKFSKIFDYRKGRKFKKKDIETTSKQIQNTAVIFWKIQTVGTSEAI